LEPSGPCFFAIVAFRTNLPSQGIRQGDQCVVQGIDKGQVVLAMVDGSQLRFEPDRLPRNLAYDAVTIYEPRQLPLFAGTVSAGPTTTANAAFFTAI